MWKYKSGNTQLFKPKWWSFKYLKQRKKLIKEIIQDFKKGKSIYNNDTKYHVQTQGSLAFSWVPYQCFILIQSSLNFC